MSPHPGPPPGPHPGPRPPSRYVTHVEFDRRLNDLWSYVLGQTGIVTQLGEKLMATQADIDALAAKVSADVTAINAEIAALQAANPALDLTGLQAAVASLDVTANPPAPPAG